MTRGAVPWPPGGFLAPYIPTLVGLACYDCFVVSLFRLL